MHPFPFRPLTLGVAIVVGGTLAALPFRRHRSAGELACSSPRSSDGPIGSNLLSAPRQDFLRMPRPLEPDPLRDDGHHRERQARSIRRQRPMHAPLTYKDIAVPIDRRSVAHRQPAAGEARRTRPKQASGAPQDFRLKTQLPPETDFQPLALSEPPTAGLAGNGGGSGPRSVLLPTPNQATPTESPAAESPAAESPAAESPAAERPQRSAADPPAASAPTAPTPKTEPSADRTERLADNAPPRSAPNPPHAPRADVRDGVAGSDEASRSRNGPPGTGSATLTSSKLSGASRALSVTGATPSHDPRKRHWIRQPQ